MLSPYPGQNGRRRPVQTVVSHVASWTSQGHRVILAWCQRTFACLSLAFSLFHVKVPTSISYRYSNLQRYNAPFWGSCCRLPGLKPLKPSNPPQGPPGKPYVQQQPGPQPLQFNKFQPQPGHASPTVFKGVQGCRLPGLKPIKPSKPSAGPSRQALRPHVPAPAQDVYTTSVTQISEAGRGPPDNPDAPPDGPVKPGAKAAGLVQPQSGGGRV